jgi:hypothetical protein
MEPVEKQMLKSYFNLESPLPAMIRFCYSLLEFPWYPSELGNRLTEYSYPQS